MRFKQQLLLIALLLCGTATLYGQSQGVISGLVYDDQRDEGIIGAFITCFPTSDTTQITNTATGEGGYFKLTALPYGEYTIRVDFLGYKQGSRTFNLNKDQFTLNRFSLATDSKALDAIKVEHTAMRTSAKGDTLIYNADAFQVTKDADTESLLAKMPGITVLDGEVTAHGEEVEKVFVDGKEFFGSDVTLAIKNLPAEAVDKIEVYNKLSDEAEFSGVDDGEGFKAINIVTRPNMRNGTFGKFYAGYGTDNYYSAGASVNIFNEKRRVSIIGMANNINQQNFGSEDILGAMSTTTSSGSGRNQGGGSGTSGYMTSASKGITTLASIGVNYTEEYSDKVKAELSYFYNRTKTDTYSTTNRDYYMSEGATQYYDAITDKGMINSNHRINGRVDYNINDKNMLMWRPSISIQTNESTTIDTSATSSLSSTALEQALLNVFSGLNTTSVDGYNISNNLLYRRKVGAKAGRIITASVGYTLSNNHRKERDSSITTYFDSSEDIIDGASIQELNQYINNRSSGYKINGRFSYSEPISKRSQLILNYFASYDYSDIDKSTYDLPDYTFSADYSNIYNSGYMTQSVGPGYRYNTDKTNLVAGVTYQYSALLGDQTYPTASNTSSYFNNITYMGMLNTKFNPSNNLRVMLRSSTNNPSITQLQNVLDISDPLFVTQGNENLNPVYINRLYANYVRSNIEKGRTFIASLGGSMQSNYIANAVQRAESSDYQVLDSYGNLITTLEAGEQYTSYVNLDGYWNVNFSLSYGAPLKFISSNINLDARIDYTATPGIYNNILNTTNTTTYTGGATLGSNISQNFDFTLTYRAGYNTAVNEERPESNNDYLSQYTTGSIKWITFAGITLQSNGTYSKYTGITDDFREEYFIWNASIGKKVFKGQRGEINLSVNDILNQNTSFVRNVTDTYIENVKTNAIGRYFSLNFVYQLRNFNGKSMGPSSFEKGGPDSMGPPPDGGGGRGMGGPPM